MTSTTGTANSPATTNPTTQLIQRGPLVRVVFGSLLAGLAGAALMVLLVVPGAQEHVVTGSVLLSFAGSWGLLAVLSARLTSSPQPWAVFPAGVMAVTGLTLLVFTPGNSALENASWVWPPLLLALTVWIVVQVRRSMPGRARWLLYPVVGVLALASVGGMTQAIVGHQDAGEFARPGSLYDVGGHRLHMNCTGSGSPTVVLENGLGGSSPQWGRVVAATAGTTRVCAYDRAGQGWSDDASGPQDSLAVVRDLHTLLQVAGEHGPYVLAGHSAGGAYVMTFAAQHPAEVAGLVLVDSVSPRQFTVLKDFPGQYAMLRRLYGVAPMLTRMGVGQLTNLFVHSEVPGVAGHQVDMFAASPRAWRTQRDEHSVYRDAFREAQALTTLGNKPLEVVTASDSVNKTAGWDRAQTELTHLSSNARRRDVTSTHPGLLENKSASASTAAAIADVVLAVRSGTPLRAG
jgi:pimeloyl-ACP methyl ester carboxylesterase